MALDTRSIKRVENVALKKLDLGNRPDGTIVDPFSNRTNLVVGQRVIRWHGKRIMRL